ncbi:c-type cytochrome [Aureimonas leprariae]|uniref:C-type cytochrome n=1 Tax=Plantimonas leprariae TaxID=2615207 RepID=A0A7V7TVF8_9HYPH|nr:cytochrome c [Aureimonas leprariae]KAB0677738.1 c-type cytochrome [Aureimonas leprariae]
MKIARIALAGLGLVAVATVAGIAYAWEPAIDRVERPAPAAFDGRLVAEGAKLAAVGNCIACHTVPGGKSFAGGLAIPTPFGTIHSSNITPDEETGIGRWSEAAFVRSMRRGVDREGNHLYPAFPYDHYTLVSDTDNRALYAYLMTRTPVRATPPPNDLPFPLNIRMSVAGWKLLFFREGEFRPDPTKSERVNRGAYLAEGLAHCGACHTPRNILGAEKKAEHWAGGEAEGWNSYAINRDSHAPIPWNSDALAHYLRHGWHAEHGVARGPMAEVTGNLAGLPDADVDAMAAYAADVMGPPAPERLAAAEGLRRYVAGGGGPGGAAPAGDSLTAAVQPASTERGEAVYAAACATCHASGRPQPYGGLDFHLSTAVAAPDPGNIVTVVLHGLPPGDGDYSSVMPAFAGTLSDADAVALLAYMRRTFTDKPAWTDLEKLVADTRSGARHVVVRPADGIERSPTNVGARD